jgi:hypothetical protein
MASISKIAYINKVLNNYRDHVDNVSKKASVNLNHLKEYFLIYDWIFKNMKVKNKKQVMSYFDGFTKHSLSLFNQDQRKKYETLYEINKKLFFHMIKFNIMTKVVMVLKRIKSY